MKTQVINVMDRLDAALAGRNSLQRELGRGGMATAYLAQDLRPDRPIALKGLHPELAATLGPERFQREIRIAAQLEKRDSIHRDVRLRCTTGTVMLPP